MNGVAAPKNEFDIVAEPTSLTFLSSSIAAEPSYDVSTCTTSYAGVFGDLKFQINGPGGAPINTDILMTPFEDIVFPDGSKASADIGPVSGYPTSSKYAADDGTFHNVPFGACTNPSAAPYSNVPMGTQTVSIYIGNNRYEVKVNVWSISSSGVNHGAITNGKDISFSR